MAEVWMGRRETAAGAGKAVAIKLLATHLAGEATYRRMFADEARLTMMLNHSNIVQVFDVGEHGGRSFLVMEWVDGLDLARLGNALREAGEPMPLAVAAHVVGELLRGLAYAHELREGDASCTIVHRDISPHNVLVSVSGEVKISDFGVARMASEETSGLHVRGKLRYMPPEQIRGDSRRPTVDLFAVGAVLHELLDGVRFRAGNDRDGLLATVIHGEVPPLRRDDLPPELVALRDGLLAADPAARLQTAREALALLRSWPGYRNAADELAALVRAHLGVEGPRSGLGVSSSDERLELAPEPTRREPTARGLSAAHTRVREPIGGSGSRSVGGSASAPASLGVGLEASCEAGLRAGLGAGTEGGAHHRSDTTPSIADAGGTMSRSPVTPSRARAAGVVAAGIVGIAVLLGLGAAGLGARTPAATVVASAPAIVAAPSTSAIAAPPTAAPPTAAQPSTPAPPDAEPAVAAKPAKAKPSRAKVEVVAHEFFFAWVKIAGREHALEPVAQLSLRPGKHTVYLRESAEQPWRKAGEIEIDGGKRYRVALRKPNGVTLERLD